MLGNLLFHKLTYAGMFVLLAGAGIVAPVPEELTLLTSGYFSAIGLMDPWRAIPLAIVALLIGDSILFGLAKVGSNYARKVHDRLMKTGLDKTWIFSPEKPLRAVFFMRFVTGLRMISPVFAGFNEASWFGFWATTLGALVIFVPVMFGLGYHFHATFFRFVAGFELIRHIVFWSILAVVGGGMMATMRHHVKRLWKGKPKDVVE